ncbi:hypothetical protein SNEBB_007228 [Seison nebaliae]|nr:hypothetical protein SNEBB_007228 [Seison nebaliae]
MGISRDGWHKRRATGGKRPQPHKKRKHEMGRPASSTKLGEKKVKRLRVRGGNEKVRALKLDHGNFSWASEGVSRKTRIVDIVYNASSNDLVRTKTLVKSCIVLVDATPFRQWYEAFYAKKLVTKKSKAEKEETKKVNLSTKKKKRQKNAEVDSALSDIFESGKLYAKISSRPGQVGRSDGYVLEGRELDFYVKKIKSKKRK